MNTKKLLALLIASCMLLGLLAGCTSGTVDQSGGAETTGSSPETTDNSQASTTLEPQYGGHLNVAFSTAMHGIDPVTKAKIWYYMYETCVFENPLTRDAENRIAPGVCDYELAEDGMSIKLWPREGITFHDGTPVEAEDVKASIERAVVRGNGVKKMLGPAIKTMEINVMDEQAAAEFLLDGANNWDMQLKSLTGAHTPTTLRDEYYLSFYVSEERDRLLAELKELQEGSAEYLAKWQELHKLMVEDCSIVHIGFYNWTWYHRQTLHPDYEGDQPYFFNSWWEDPENHTAG